MPDKIPTITLELQFPEAAQIVSLLTIHEDKLRKDAISHVRAGFENAASTMQPMIFRIQALREKVLREMGCRESDISRVRSQLIDKRRIE